MVLIIFQKIKLINLKKRITKHVNECQGPNEILKISLLINRTLHWLKYYYFFVKTMLEQGKQRFRVSLKRDVWNGMPVKYLTEILLSVIIMMIII